MQKFRFTFRAMACDNVIEIYASAPGRAHHAATAAIEEVARLEAKYSRYISGSVVSLINAAAGIAPVEIDEETAHLFDYASVCFEQSGGLFDITAGILRRAWDFKADQPPARDIVDPLLPLIGWRRVDRTPATVFLPLPGMEIDFGGFGKEYAADRAAAVLLALGLPHAFVSLGGDVVVTGPRADGEPWQLGIRHPRNRQTAIVQLPIASGAVATSGDYERYIDFGGRRYSHILDPRSGESINSFQSVTVLASTCLVAGSVTTIAMLKGEIEGAQWLADSGAIYFAVSKTGAAETNLAAN